MADAGRRDYFWARACGNIAIMLYSDRGMWLSSRAFDWTFTKDLDFRFLRPEGARSERKGEKLMVSRRLLVGLAFVLIMAQFGCATSERALDNPWTEYPPPGAWKGVDQHANGVWWMPSKIGGAEGYGNKGVIFYKGTASLPLDSDGDGVLDNLDKCPGTPKGVKVDKVGCPLDSDGDGVADNLDKCPGTPKGVKVDKVGCPLDSDGDGVADYLDKCPGTPKGVKVDKVGCPLDSDGDGVVDYLDKCPDTPKGVKVDASGCPLDSDGDGVADYLDKCPDTLEGAPVNSVGCWSIKGINFDNNKSNIKPQYQGLLDENVAVLKKNPSVKVQIQGHTDSKGSEAYNQALSERRAEAVKNYIAAAGIGASRISSRGYGEKNPIATNETAEGRAKNRRIEVKIIKR